MGDSLLLGQSGNAVLKQEKVVTPTMQTQVLLPNENSLFSKVTVLGDDDLVAENIRSGVNIFGVNGNYEYEGENLYIWKRYEVNCPIAENPTFRLASTSSSRLLTLSEANFDVTLIENWKKFFDGFTNADSSGYPFFKDIGNLTWNLQKKNNTSAGYFTISSFTTSNSSNATFNMSESTSFYSTNVRNDVYTFEGSKPMGELGDSYDFVVSNDEFRYPDEGMQNGYWYEKLTSSPFEVTHGTVSMGSNSSDTLIPHGLGKTPSYFGINGTIGSNGIGPSATISADATNIKITKSTSFNSSTLNWVAVSEG